MRHLVFSHCAILLARGKRGLQGLMAMVKSYRPPHWRALVRPEFGLACLAIALAMAVPSMLEVTATRGAAQLDNSKWQAFANDFLENSSVVKVVTKAPDAQTYAQAFATGGVKIVMQEDLRIMASLETFTKRHFETAAGQRNEINCLSQAIYYEARSEPLKGQLAVAQVVLNRVKHRAYPSNICDVVFEGSTRITGCQFTFTCDGSMTRNPRGNSWKRSRQAAIHAVLGMSDVTIHRATHYHTVAISPYWSKTLLRTANIGTHVFYRFPSRREKVFLAEAA